MERKTGFELKGLDEKGQFIARIARLNMIDHDQDVTLRGAFGNEQVAPLLVGHEWRQIPLGKASIREEADEVLAYGKLNLALDAGRSLYEALKFDLANPPVETEFSYGFVLNASEPGLFEGQRVRFLKSVRVLEVSAVLAGAGDTALLAVKEDQRDADEELVLSQAHALAKYGVLLARGAALEDKLSGGHQYNFVHVDRHPDWWHTGWRAQMAKEAVYLAGKELGQDLSQVLRTSPSKLLSWFTSAPPREVGDFREPEPIGGFCDRKAGTIALSHDVGPEELVTAAAHETAHLAGMDEPAAAKFAGDFVRRYAAQLLGGTEPRSAIRPAMGPMILSSAEAKEFRRRWGVPVPIMDFNFNLYS